MAFHFGRSGGWNNPRYKDCITCKAKGCTQKPPQKWEAIYRNSRKEPYWILGDDNKPISCERCPVAVITDESLNLIQLHRTAALAKEATGACLYGPDLSEWPSKIVAAFTVIQSEANNAEAARQESEYGR